MQSWWCWCLLGLTIAASKVDEDEDGLLSLLEWIGDQGGLINYKIELRAAATGNQRVVVAIEDIPQDEAIMTVPLDAILAPHQSDNPTACDTAWTLIDEYNRVNEDGSTASNLDPYINTLLDLIFVDDETENHENQLPMIWSSEGEKWMLDLVGRELPRRDFDLLGIHLDDCFGYAIEEIYKDSILRILRMTYSRGWNSHVLIPIYDHIQQRTSYPQADEDMVRVDCEAVGGCSILAERDIYKGEVISNTAYNSFFPDEHLFDVFGAILPCPHVWAINSEYGQMVLKLDLDPMNDNRFEVTWLSEPPNIMVFGWLVSHQKRLRGIDPPMLQDEREQRIAEAFFEALVVVVDQAILWSNGNPYNGLTDMEGEGEEEYNFVQQSFVEETYATSRLPGEASSYISNSDDFSVGRKNVSKYCQQDVRCSTDSKDTLVAIKVVNASSTTQVATSHSSINESGIDESEEPIGITSHNDSTSNYFDSLEERPDPLDYNDGTPGTCIVEFDEGTVTSDSIVSNYQEIEWEHYIISEYNQSDTCLRLDGYFHSCATVRPHVHETIIHYPLSFVDEVKRVLYVGGGDVIILNEILKYPSLELVIGTFRFLSL